MKIVTISDTHLQHRKLKIPDGDVLIHAGDITSRGGLENLAEFNEWIGSLPHKHKVVIFGNHDKYEFNLDVAKEFFTNCHFLHDSEVVIDGVKYYGSPWSPTFGWGWAWNMDRGKKIKAKWDLIPNDTDVLITHGPPFGYCDLVVRGEHVGCQDLLERIEIIKPKLHVFGHIHESKNTDRCVWDDGSTTEFVNASSLNLQYMPQEKPWEIIHLETGQCP